MVIGFFFVYLKDHSILEHSKIICVVDKVSWYMPIKISMKENGLIIKLMGLEFIFIQTDR